MIEITNGLIVFNSSSDCINIQQIKNRRFMFNPNTGTVVIGKQYHNCLTSSHSEEFFLSGLSESFDNFIRGWIGTSSYYKNGIIHFAPAISEATYNAGYDTLIMLLHNGATEYTNVRGFMGQAAEPQLKEILKIREVHAA